MPNSPKYVIISPVKDEERYVEFTIKSVIGQTLKPELWVIVDDGSTDRTPEIVSRYLSSHPFIRMVSNPKAGFRQTGSAVIRAFSYGYEALGETDYEFIVKLDCDLSFGADHFEQLLEKFKGDERLGIASGVYFEQAKQGLGRKFQCPLTTQRGRAK